MAGTSAHWVLSLFVHFWGIVSLISKTSNFGESAVLYSHTLLSWESWHWDYPASFIKGLTYFKNVRKPDVSSLRCTRRLTVFLTNNVSFPSFPVHTPELVVAQFGVRVSSHVGLLVHMGKPSYTRMWFPFPVCILILNGLLERRPMTTQLLRPWRRDCLRFASRTPTSQYGSHIKQCKHAHKE